MGRTDPPTLHTLPVRSTLERWLPLLRLLRIYQLKWLIKDLFAGLAPCAVLVPVGLSYAALGIIEVRNVQRPWRIHRNEFAVSILSFVGVVTLGALPGILIAVGLALISFVWRTRSRPFGKPDSY